MGKYDLFLLAGGAAVLVYGWQKGYLTEFFDHVDNILGKGKGKGKTPKEEGEGGDGEGTGEGKESAGSTGNCPTTVYTKTGQTLNAKATGIKTRHYASGKADDKTAEWNTKTNLKAYEVTWYGNIGKPDHDDNIAFKLLGGTHDDGKGAWYTYDLSFKKGLATFGYEKPHPSTTTGCLKGKSVGSIENKNIGAKAVIWPTGSGYHVEGWADVDGKWQKLIEANNPCGKKFDIDSRGQQVQVRIDAAPKVKSTCCTVQEIKAPSASFSTAKYAFSYPAYVRPAVQEISHECGFVCAMEQTNLADLPRIQRGFRRG